MGGERVIWVRPRRFPVSLKRHFQIPPHQESYIQHGRQVSPDKNVHPVEFPEGNPIQQGKLSLHNRSIYPISRTLGFVMWC